MQILGIVAFVVALLFSVMVHEFGHYLTARHYGMKVSEFFLGFGKRLWSTQRGETEFGIKAIPAGGYCRIEGMTATDEMPPGEESRAFYKANSGRKLIVLGAGSFLHFVLGFILLIILFSSVGITSLTNKVERISECIPQTSTEVCSPQSVPSPAKIVGIKAGDKIVKVNSVAYTEWNDVVTLIRASAGKPLNITVERDGTLLDFSITPAARALNNEVIGVIGVINQIGTLTWNPI